MNEYSSSLTCSALALIGVMPTRGKKPLSYLSVVGAAGTAEMCPGSARGGRDTGRGASRTI